MSIVVNIKKRLTCIGIMILGVTMSVCGCGVPSTGLPRDTEISSQVTSIVQNTLSVQETEWSELGSSTAEPVVFTPLQQGDVVYDSRDTKITIGEVDDSKIVLIIDGYMVEKGDDGTIDLRADPLEEIEVEYGSSVELASQSMSSGFDLIISYE